MDILALLDELRMLARNALPFTHDPYDRARYRRILELVDQYYGSALNLPPADVRRRLAAELGRVTPKVGANVAIFNPVGEILLMRRSDSSQWCLPGGLVEVTERPADTAVREALEETGLRCRIVELVDMFTRPAAASAGPHSLIAVVYLCEVEGGELQGSSEGPEVQYWAIPEVDVWETDHRQQADAAYACWAARHGQRSPAEPVATQSDAADRWVPWARAIAAISQNGLAYSTDLHDRERFAQLAQVAAEMVTADTGLGASALAQQLRAQVGYATPKIDVRGAIVVDQRVLLVQERSDGRWCLPGGWAEVGESPAAAVEREVREECGLTVQARKLVGVYDADYNEAQRAFSHAYKLVFLCEPRSGTPTAGNEITAVADFGFDALPPLSARRTDRRHVADIQAHVADPTTNTAFD